MVWLKSTTGKAWTVNISADKGGLIVPGVNDTKYLQLSDSEYSTLKKKPVFASLIKAGDILVATENPLLSEEHPEILQAENSELNDKLLSMEKELADVRDALAAKEAAYEELKQQAIDELREKVDIINAYKDKYGELTGDEEG